jgi:hypothetical protein
MNLVQINERLKDMPEQVIRQYANGMNPEVPPYLALGELQRRELSNKQMATAQGGQQGPQPSVKEQIEQRAGLMGLQQMQQQQMAQQQPRGPMPAPAGVPQPQAQPQAPMMARGGLASIPVRSDMFEYAGGGIIAFANGGDTMGTPSLEQQELTSQAASITDEMVAERRNKAKLIAELEQKLAFLTNAGAPQATEVRAQLEALKGPEASRAAPKPAPVEQASLRAMDNKMMPARLPGAVVDKGVKPPAAPRPIAEAPVAPAAPMPQAGLPAAAQSVNPYEARLNQVALKEPVAPTTQDAISRVNELSPAAMQEAALQKRNQEMRDRATGYKEQFEKSRPSGLDDLIRVFGQAGQYKGGTGLAPAYTANQQQKRAEELAMTRQYNELMNLADTKELEGSKELFKARTGAFDTAQQLFGKEKDNVVKATASLYETTQSRINNELKLLSDKEIQNLKMAQETKITGMGIDQRERERKSLDARDPNAKLAEYVGLKAKARELREKGDPASIKQADSLMARAADIMEYKGGASTAGQENAETRSIRTALEAVNKRLELMGPDEPDYLTLKRQQKNLSDQLVDRALGNSSSQGGNPSGEIDKTNPLLK